MLWVVNESLYGLGVVLIAIAVVPRISATGATQTFNRYADKVLSILVVNVVGIDVPMLCLSPFRGRLLRH